MDNKEDIILVIEFMSGKYVPDPRDPDDITDGRTTYPHNWYYGMTRYDTSLGNQSEVLKKLKSLDVVRHLSTEWFKYDDGKSGYSLTIKSFHNFNHTINNYSEVSEEEANFKAIIKFIKWYNEIKDKDNG